MQVTIRHEKTSHFATAGKCKRHPNRALTEAQIRNLLSAIENIRDDALIRLGLSVGLRVSEVVSIRTSEIDFERGLIKIWDEKKGDYSAPCHSERSEESRCCQTEIFPQKKRSSK